MRTLFLGLATALPLLFAPVSAQVVGKPAQSAPRDLQESGKVAPPAIQQRWDDDRSGRDDDRDGYDRRGRDDRYGRNDHDDWDRGGYGRGWNDGRDEWATIRCSSKDHRYELCRVGAYVRDVRLVDVRSDSGCRRGRDWGTRADGVWVDIGCRAEFAVNLGSQRGRGHGRDYDDHRPYAATGGYGYGNQRAAVSQCLAQLQHRYAPRDVRLQNVLSFDAGRNGFFDLVLTASVQDRWDNRRYGYGTGGRASIDRYACRGGRGSVQIARR
ncbi:DUF3011 domain-containing protein [Parvularcula dongshanensis]|uniref:DUF3011 domain-containing protein n=1 Tax=Parvularcula dongshanensis TaxID=1173995 RepID=A0A840I792_9PROT|nr:DUF3011 domain-containing protein [Parvularcula dongshanensis]MBB4660044.1 hypothetical protein [Parvularcula dongshanensis]